MKENPVDVWYKDKIEMAEEAACALREPCERIMAVFEDDSAIDVSVVQWLLSKPFLFVKRDLKDDERLLDVVKPILAKLAALGHRIENNDDPYEDYPEIRRRTWKLTGRVKVAIFMGESGVCRYVKTGTKKFEDQFELVCDDSEMKAGVK